MDEIMWHRRESRRPTENTNVILESWESPVYSQNQKGPRRRGLTLFPSYVLSLVRSPPAGGRQAAKPPRSDGQTVLPSYLPT